jgi:hypothetical protein
MGRVRVLAQIAEEGSAMPFYKGWKDDDEHDKKRWGWWGKRKNRDHKRHWGQGGHKKWGWGKKDN